MKRTLTETLVQIIAFRSIKDGDIEVEEPNEAEKEPNFSEIQRLEEQMLEYLNDENRSRDVQQSIYSRDFLYLIRSVVKVSALFQFDHGSPLLGDVSTRPRVLKAAKGRERAPGNGHRQGLDAGSTASRQQRQTVRQSS